MSTFTVKANSYLRNIYAPNRTYSTTAGRAEATNSQLVSADSIALKKSIKNLASFDYDEDEDDVLDTTKANFTYKLHNFVDAYNYTLQSSANSADKYINHAGANMKKLSKKYEQELADLGISISSSGYLKISSTATTNVDLQTYGSMFSSSSDYTKALKKYSNIIDNHVDTYA